jgi:hypothetical protein
VKKWTYFLGTRELRKEHVSQERDQENVCQAADRVLCWFSLKCPFWACGPRNLMKIGQSKMVTAGSSEVDSLTGEAEAVEMSDPERA